MLLAIFFVLQRAFFDANLAEPFGRGVRFTRDSGAGVPPVFSH